MKKETLCDHHLKCLNCAALYFPLMNPREGMTAGRAELPQRYSIQGLQMPSRAPSDLINTSVLAIQRKFPIHQEITGRRERVQWEIRSVLVHDDQNRAPQPGCPDPAVSAELVWRSLGGQQEEDKNCPKWPRVKNFMNTGPGKQSSLHTNSQAAQPPPSSQSCPNTQGER